MNEIEELKDRLITSLSELAQAREHVNYLGKSLNDQDVELDAKDAELTQLRDRITAMRSYMESRASAPKRSHWENFIALNPEYAPEQPPIKPSGA